MIGDSNGGGAIMNIWFRMIVFAGVLLVVFIGIAITVDNWQYRMSSEPATAEILSMREEDGSIEDEDGFSNIEVYHFPTVRFNDRSGYIYEVEVAHPIAGAIPEIGDQIPIRYEVANPGYVRDEKGLFYDWLVGGAIMAIGLIFFTITYIFTRPEVREI